MRTRDGHELPPALVGNYLDSLVNRFFKILPIKESGEPSLNEFMSSLQAELIGCRDLMEDLHHDAMYMSLLSVLQYLIDNDCDVKVVKREVFKSISLLKKLKQRYGGKEV